MRPMRDWGGYTIGSFVPYTGSRTFADVKAQADPNYKLTARAVDGPCAANGRAKNLAGHRYGSHRGTDPYTPPIAALALTPQPLQASDATTDPRKQQRLAGFTNQVPATQTILTNIINKRSSGQYQ